MSIKLNRILTNIQLLIDNGEMIRKLEAIRIEYKRNIRFEEDLQTGFGHVFSRMSLSRFEDAVRRNTNVQEGDFRQYLNKLMFENNVTQATLSRRSLIKEATLSRYINGSREVPACIVFRIALSMQLGLVETETLLQKLGKSFKEARMDAVIIEAIEQGIYDVMKVETIVQKFTEGEESLFTKKEREEFGFTKEDFEIEVI
ncbi:XRE family transcriptional regulator [Radiobacillus deserti]|uniref:XRE family transcriptional regulator n=1 Tax=Radiobacillus deserti TaxID=2594883 RepID=A0A516KKR0_9BACI|nr:XRE family transcriptional regulator [Radiobacillus deserti]QDP41976.1 XRE family transcriptional regulator [Radiobacillus deserti]